MAETSTLTSEQFVRQCLVLASGITGMPIEKIRVDHDKEADVLHLSSRKPQRATESVETDDDVLIRKDGEDIVGVTILNASTR